MSNETLDVIVRLHDVRKLRELDRCIFSLVAQNYRPLHIHLAVQRFTPEMIEETRSALAPLLAMDGAPGFSLLNWQHAEPADARSVLINLGLAAAQGRYLAFLDYDDVLYPEALELLVKQLHASQAAIAFGGICVRGVDVSSAFLYIRNKLLPFSGNDLLDLFRDNFCPIHSFVVDRMLIPGQFLFFEPLMSRLEDYDFLLRICAQFPSDFSRVRTIVGDYYVKNDGSNTVINDSPGSAAREFIEQRRRTTPVAAAVQRALGLRAPVKGLTIRALLDGAYPAAPDL